MAARVWARPGQSKESGTPFRSPPRVAWAQAPVPSSADFPGASARAGLATEHPEPF